MFAECKLTLGQFLKAEIICETGQAVIPGLVTQCGVMRILTLFEGVLRQNKRKWFTVTTKASNVKERFKGVGANNSRYERGQFLTRLFRVQEPKHVDFLWFPAGNVGNNFFIQSAGIGVHYCTTIPTNSCLERFYKNGHIRRAMCNAFDTKNLTKEV